MRVLVDGNGLQARVHAQDGKRLETFLALLCSIPHCEVVFSPGEPLTAGTLASQDILVITTRKDAEAPYSGEEIDCILDSVRRGGGLLLMSNHGDIPGRYPDMTKSDAILARRFDIEIENTFFANPEMKSLTEFSESDFLTTHPIIRGGVGEEPVRSIVTSNCCSISSPDGAPLIRMTSRMIDHRNGFPSRGRCFAIALESSLQVAGGRVVVVADSGFIGTEETTFPGVGLIEQGDNRRFVHNIVRWLGRTL